MKRQNATTKYLDDVQPFISVHFYVYLPISLLKEFPWFLNIKDKSIQAFKLKAKWEHK